MTRKYLFALVSVLLVAGCASSPEPIPVIWVTGISESLTRYYIPATTWQEKTDRSTRSRPDMTYINEPGRPVVCNISFFNEKNVPNEISSIYFMADGKIHLLNDVSTMFTRIEHNELRITSVIEINELMSVFQSERIEMRAVIDSVEYSFEPSKEFLQYREQFLKIKQ